MRALSFPKCKGTENYCIFAMFMQNIAQIAQSCAIVQRSHPETRLREVSWGVLFHTSICENFDVNLHKYYLGFTLNSYGEVSTTRLVGTTRGASRLLSPVHHGGPSGCPYKRHKHPQNLHRSRNLFRPQYAYSRTAVQIYFDCGANFGTSQRLSRQGQNILKTTFPSISTIFICFFSKKFAFSAKCSKFATERE